MTNGDRIVANGVQIAGRTAMVVPSKNKKSPAAKAAPKSKPHPAKPKTEFMKNNIINLIKSMNPPAKITKPAQRKKATPKPSSMPSVRFDEIVDVATPGMKKEPSQFKSEKELKSAYEKALLKQGEGMQLPQTDLDQGNISQASIRRPRMPAARSRPDARILEAIKEVEESTGLLGLGDFEVFALSKMPPRHRPGQDQKLRLGGPKGWMTLRDLLEEIANEYDCKVDELLIVDKAELAKLDGLRSELTKLQKENAILKLTNEELRSEWRDATHEIAALNAELEEHTGAYISKHFEKDTKMT